MLGCWFGKPAFGPTKHAKRFCLFVIAGSQICATARGRLSEHRVAENLLTLTSKSSTLSEIFRAFVSLLSFFLCLRNSAFSEHALKICSLLSCFMLLLCILFEASFCVWSIGKPIAQLLFTPFRFYSYLCAKAVRVLRALWRSNRHTRKTPFFFSLHIVYHFTKDVQLVSLI